jgi:tRNA nucleotidyltransferase (CCA-adding enzyme)
VKLHSADDRIAAALPPGSLYVVGGRVRDEIRAELAGIPLPPVDSDYVVTGVPLEDLRRRLETLGRVDLVGAAFSIFKVTVDGEAVDVALPRRDRKTGEKHRDFDVQSGPDIPLEDDLARRDFRMNMIARALPSGTLVDPYGGEADIRARRIDMLRPETFEEDPLRMLRAAQFAARLAYHVTPETERAMARAAPLVATVSAERVAEELTKLLKLAERPSIGLELLRRTKVLGYVWPELLEGVDVEQNEWHAFDVWGHAMHTVNAAPPGDLVLRLAALLHDVGKPRTKAGPHFYRHEIVGAEMTHDMLARYRFSNETMERTAQLVRYHMYAADPDFKDATIRRFIRRVGVSSIERLFDLRHADIAGSGLPERGDYNERFEARVREEIARKPALSINDLAIDGNDVIDAMIRNGVVPRGYNGDARVGEALRWLFEQVTDKPERNVRETLLALLDRYIAEPAARKS